MRETFILLMVTLALLSGSSLALGQPKSTSKDQKSLPLRTFTAAADDITLLVKSGKTKEAAAALNQLKPMDSNERAKKYFLEGLLFVKTGRIKDAMDVNDRAIGENPNFYPALFNNACLYSLDGQKAKALTYLARLEATARDPAIRLKYSKQIKSDPDLASIRKDAEYQKILIRLNKKVADGGNKVNFFEMLAKKNQGVTATDVAFIDKSFRKHGNTGNSGFGDYSGGLEQISKTVPSITITKDTNQFFVSFGASSWDFAVSIDRKTGAWINPVQGYVEEAPDPGPGPGD